MDNSTNNRMKNFLLLLLLIICSGISGCDDYIPDHTEIQSTINLSATSSVVRIKPKSKKLQRILDKVIIASKIEGEYITAVKYASYVTYYPPFENTSGVTRFPVNFQWLSVSKDGKQIVFEADPELANQSDIKTLYVIARARYDGYSDDTYIWEVKFE